MFRVSRGISEAGDRSLINLSRMGFEVTVGRQGAPSTEGQSPSCSAREWRSRATTRVNAAKDVSLPASRTVQPLCKPSANCKKHTKRLI